MHLKTGQRLVVKFPYESRLINGTVLACFKLNEVEASSLRHKSPYWARVKKGDRAVRFAPLNAAPMSEPLVFVLGHTDIYVSAH